MKKDDKEKWIEQLRQKLDDFSEDVPESVWDRIEKDSMRKIVPFWRRWQSIAAIIILAIVSSVMVTLWDSSSEYIQKQQDKNISNLNIESKPIMTGDETNHDRIAILSREDEKPIKTKKDGTLSKNVVKAVASDWAMYNDSENETIPAKESPQVEKLSQKETNAAEKGNISSESKSETKSETNTETSQKQASNQKRRAKESLYQYNANNIKREKQWSIALNSGGLGVNSTSNINGAMMRFSNSDYGLQQDPISSSLNMGSDNFIRNNYFADLSTINSIKTKKKHYQPVTFGLSVKFELDRDWSLETGLTYSYLFSKLDSDLGSDMLHQEQSLKYIGVPIKIGRNIVSLNKVNIYGSAGGEVETPISGKLKTYNVVNGKENLESEEDIDISKLQFSVGASIGAEYKLAKRFGIYAEPGIVYYFDDNSGIETIRKEHPLNFNIKLGVRFTFLK